MLCYTILFGHPIPPTQIPRQPLYARPLATALLGGLLPFGSAAIELSSLYASAWNGRIYYVRNKYYTSAYYTIY
jgi:hypothetical protein